MRYIFIIFLLAFSNANAFNLGDALNKLEDKVTEKSDDGKVTLKIPGENLFDNLSDDIKKIAQEKINKLENKINDKISEEMQGLEKIKIKAKATIKKAEKLIFFSKLAFIIFSSSILLLLLIIYRLSKKLKNLYNLMDNIRSYKDIEKRVSKLEGK